MKFNYLLFIIFISSCNSNLDRYSTSVVTTDTALSVVNSNETKGNCRESANLNTENLKLGSVKNLQSYNGIKNFKFELAKNTFVDCLECTTIGNGLDSCKIKNSLNFLDKEWTGDVYFINDSLSRIEVQLSNTDLTDVYFRLKTIFGIPNVQNHKVVRSKNSIRNIKVSGNHKRDYRPYSESINDYYLLSMEIQMMMKILLIYRLMIYDFDKSIYSGEPKKVRYQYFSEVEIQSIWNSNVTMTLKNISQSYIREQFKSLSGEELYSSYNSFYSPSVRTDYEVVLNLYKNKKTEDFFINYRKMVLQKNLSNIKKTELREKEKLLKKF